MLLGGNQPSRSRLRNMPKCERCGLTDYHGENCTVKAIEYRVDGSIKRVELLTPLDFPAVTKQEPEEDYPKLGAKRA